MGQGMMRLLWTFFGPVVKFAGRWVSISVGIALIAWFVLPRAEPLGQDTTLYISIDRPLAETTPLDAMPYLQFLLQAPTLSATTIATTIHEAIADENIAKIAVSLTGPPGTDIGSANRVGDALKKASKAGKTVTVYASNFDNAKYLLATHADEVLMHPMGRFDVGGIKTGTLYFGDALERFVVKVVVGQAGAFKNAVEPYTRGDMSENAREAMSTVLERQKAAILKAIGERLDVDTETIEPLLNGSGGDWRIPSKRAETLGLVYRVASAPDFMDAVFGAPGDAEASPSISLSRYLTVRRPAFLAR